MDKISRPARRRPTTTMTGYGEVLAPVKYIERGTVVLLANQNALIEDPRRELSYDSWHKRYGCEPLRHGVELTACMKDDSTGFFLKALQVDGSGPQWHVYSFYTKHVIEMKKASQKLPEEAGCVGEFHISPRSGTVVIKIQDATADWDPDGEYKRLYGSEIMFQAWMDACAVHLANNQNEFRLRELRYIVIDNIVNQGTLWAIQDVLIAQGISPVSMLAGNKESMIFERGADNTCSDWFKMLMGTANGRPVARMCADHGQVLGKHVKKIYAWYHCPTQMTAALVFELEDVEPLPMPPIQRKQTRKDKLKAFGKSVVGSIKKQFRN